MKHLNHTLRAAGLSLALAAGLAVPAFAPAAAVPTSATDGILVTLDRSASAAARSLGAGDLALLASSPVVS